jgi:hypothetical protein
MKRLADLREKPESQLRQLLKNVALGLLPYPEMVRRLRIRSRARKLIRCEPWPGNDATPVQLAELILTRALWLQRSTHRAVFLRQPEAAALLARTSVENTIVGMWCLFADDPMDKLRGENAKAMERLFRYLVEGDVLKQELVDVMKREIGGSGRLPTVIDMAELVTQRTGHQLGHDLYHRLYVPLSTFFAHGNGLAMLRHVRQDGSVRIQPAHPWVRRSSVRVADASVGILALAIAGRSGVSPDRFVAYADAHIKRALAPLFVAAAQGTGAGSLRLARLPAAYRAIIAGRDYYESEEYKADSWLERHDRTRACLSAAFDVYEPSEPIAVRDELLEIVVKMVVGSPPEEGAPVP